MALSQALAVKNEKILFLTNIIFVPIDMHFNLGYFLLSKKHLVLKKDKVYLMMIKIKRGINNGFL